MSSITHTFGQLLNTIGTVADTTTKVVQDAASSVDMLSTYIRTAKIKQEASHAIEMKTYFEDLAKEAALEEATKQQKLDELLSTNSQLRKNYDQALPEISSMLEKIKTKYYPV